MNNYERSRVALRPSWKGNLCLLLFVVAVVYTSLLALIKMTIVKLPTRAAEVDRARPEPERQLFRPPWYAEDLTGLYVVKAQEGQEVAYIYYADDPRRRAIMKLSKSR